MAVNTSLNAPYLVLTGAVVIAIAFLFAVLQPLMDSINTVKSDIASHTTELSEKNEFLQSLDAKLAQLQAQSSIEQQLATIIPEKERSQDIVRVLGQYAQESGITLVSVTTNTAQTKPRATSSKARGDINLVPDGLQAITFQLNTAGTYQQARAFMNGLQKSPRIVDISRVTISKVPTQPDAVTAAFTIKVYARAEKSAKK